MKIKLDELRKAGGKSLALTATPVLNSVAEIFNMLRIFAPGQLERLFVVEQLLLSLFHPIPIEAFQLQLARQLSLPLQLS